MTNLRHKYMEQDKQRLYPSRSNRGFYVLTQLRKHLESTTEKYFVDGQQRTLVDVGCGSMPYRPLFNPYPIHYVGVDLPGNNQADFYFTDDAKIPLANHHTDIILSTQVLEHVDDPKTYLEECFRILKPGGFLILSTHGYWNYHPTPTDYWRWTGAGLRKIIEDTGFLILETHGIMGLSAAALQLLQDSIWLKMPKIFRPIFGLFMQNMITLCDKLYTPLARTQNASVFVTISQKPTNTTD
ncbi:MAG: class I SAM-dependent methyltransferase [Chitinophagaceae bacterium]|nr:class I SAM-dependent methyltransferase [Anaerolineae bacterium]